MRNCALWISPWVAHDQVAILDTAAMTDEEWRATVHNDPDAPPKDAVLVVVHPALYQQLRTAAIDYTARAVGAGVDDVFFRGREGDRNVAAAIISQHCAKDPELARRLKW